MEVTVGASSGYSKRNIAPRRRWGKRSNNNNNNNNNRIRSNSSLSCELMMIFAMALLLGSTSFQTVLLVTATASAAVDVATRGESGSGAAMLNYGIQRKRGDGGMDEQRQLQQQQVPQLKRITNHRRLEDKNLQRQPANDRGGGGIGQAEATATATSSQQPSNQQAAARQTIFVADRTLQQQQGEMCTCSPQIFNVKISLTSTNPCSNDNLKPNDGIRATLCLYNNPMEGLYPPAPPPVPTLEPTVDPFGPTPTNGTDDDDAMLATEAPSPSVSQGTTDDPFKPPANPNPPTTPGGGGVPTYSPTSSTYSPTITGMPITPFPSFTPTKSSRGGKVAQPGPGPGSRGGGDNQQRDGNDNGDDGEETLTYHPTNPWPTFSPTTNPTPFKEDGGDDDTKQGGRGQGGGGGGGWLEEDEEPQVKSMSVDDDEVIGPHHHRHHHHSHHEVPSEEEEDENDGGSRKLLQGEQSRGRKKRLLQVINVDELFQESDKSSVEDKGDSDNKGKGKGKGKDEKSNNMEVKYQLPAVHQSTLDSWTSIHPNDVFFEEHPELKPFQEEIYRMKHGLPSSSSSTTSPAVATSTRSLQSDLTPTQLISAQFLEMDTSPNMQIINQDDQYLNVTFPDPSNIVLQFSSISNLLDPATPLSDQMEYVPGGAILVLVGATASGEVVRNRMMWTYTMGCGMEDYTVLDGNVIGWAGFENLTPAREEFCPSSGNLPPPLTPSPSVVTPAPSTDNTPTPTPSVPTTKPPSTKAPSMDMPSKKPSSKSPTTTKKPSMSMGSGDIFDHFDLSGKSKKKKKKRRGADGDTRKLDKIKEDFRTLRRRESAMEFGRPLVERRRGEKSGVVV